MKLMQKIIQNSKESDKQEDKIRHKYQRRYRHDVHILKTEWPAALKFYGEKILLSVFIFILAYFPSQLILGIYQRTPKMIRTWSGSASRPIVQGRIFTFEHDMDYWQIVGAILLIFGAYLIICKVNWNFKKSNLYHRMKEDMK